MKSISLVAFATVLAIGAYSAPYVVMFILTRFKSQQSTLLQRIWILSWLVVGTYTGVVSVRLRPVLNSHNWKAAILVMGIPMISGIGMWVFVAKMIMEGGICKIM